MKEPKFDFNNLKLIVMSIIIVTLIITDRKEEPNTSYMIVLTACLIMWILWYIDVRIDRIDKKLDCIMEEVSELNDDKD